MNYSNQGAAGSAPPVMSSLLSDSASLHVALRDIEEKVIAIGDQLLGPEPREAGEGKRGVPEPIPSMRRNIDKSQQMVQRIMDALARIAAAPDELIVEALRSRKSWPPGQSSRRPFY